MAKGKPKKRPKQEQAKPPPPHPVVSFEAIEGNLRQLERDKKLVDLLKQGWSTTTHPGDLQAHIAAAAQSYQPPLRWTLHRGEHVRIFDYDWKLIRQDDEYEYDYNPAMELLLKSKATMKLACRSGDIVEAKVADLSKDKISSSCTYRIKGRKGFGQVTGHGCPNCHGDEIYDFQFLRCPVHGKIQLWVMNWIECDCEENREKFEEGEPPGGYRNFRAEPIVD